MTLLEYRPPGSANGLERSVVVRYNVLGEVSVSVDGVAIDLGTPKERQLLATLLVEANTIVSQDRVIDALWPDRPPAKPLSSLRAYLSHLRGTLAAAGLAKEVISSEGDGYRLQLDPEAVDAVVFERLLEQARSEDLPTMKRIETLDEALTLVRSEPYADMPYAEFAQREIDRLDELIASAHQLRAELALEAGQASAWIPELTSLVRRYPYRDGIRAAQMQALALTGRHGEALRAYAEHRGRLVEDLGVEPGPALQALERELLELDMEAQVREVPGETRHLPADRTGQAWRMVTTLAIDASGSETAAEEVLLRHTGRPPTRAGRFLHCYFGLPIAHGRDPEHALRAAGRIAGEPELAAGVGVATGMALVDYEADRSARSDADEKAESLAGRAAAGSVIVDDLTRDLTSRFASFTSDEQGGHLVDDIGDPPPSTPLLGRDEELSLLSRRMRVADEGEGQMVAVGGDPGIGKTRLVDALLDGAVDADATIHRLNCSPFHQGSPFHPLVQALEDRPRLGNEQQIDSPPAQRSARRLLRRWLAEGDAALTSISADPDERRRALLRAAELELTTATGSGPVVCVVEDIQWLDDSTYELITSLAAGAPSRRFLLVMTHRMPASRELLQDPAITAIRLGPLPRSVTADIARVSSGSSELPASVLEEIATRSNGIPLFAEEITREMVERGRLDETVPATLRDSLTARLDRIPWAHDVVQAAAVIGEDFDASLVCAISRREPTTVLGDLAKLCDHGILVRRGSGSDLRYSFHHLLVRDVAYESVPPDGRAELHRQVASALEANPRGRVDHSQLAHHWSAAGETSMAVSAWLSAARNALALSAASDAIAHAERGLAEAEGGSSQGLESELSELHVVLGAAYTQRNGPASPGAAENFAAVLSREGLGADPEHRFRALWGQWYTECTGGAPAEMLPLAEQLLVYSGEFADDEIRIQAHHAMWSTLLILGRFEEVLAHTERARELYSFEDHHHLTYEYGGHDPGVCMFGTGGLAKWILGDTTAGSADAQQAILLADRLDHGYSQLEASFGVLTISSLEGAVDELRAVTEGLDHLVQAGSVPTVTRGYVDGYRAVSDIAAGGEVSRSLPALKSSAADWRDLWGAYCYPLDSALAAAHVSSGDAITGLEEIDMILEHQPNRAPWWDAELYRARADASSATGRQRSAIAADLRTSLDVARTQGAASFELRALRQLEALDAQLLGPEESERLRELEADSSRS